MKVDTLDFRGSAAALYQGKWSRFLHGCHGQNLSPCKATVPQIAELFLCLWRKLKLSLPAVKGYHAALNYIFSLVGLDLAAIRVVNRIFRSFEKMCPPREVKSLEWNLSLVLQSLTHLPYE